MLDTLTKATPEALVAIEEEMTVRLTSEVFLLVALGSQFDHLIKQSFEKLGVFCLVADPATVGREDVLKVGPKGIILSGGPASVHAEEVVFDRSILDLGIPVLGICLGFQLWADYRGLKVYPATKREFGTHELIISNPSELFSGIEQAIPVLESHGDIIKEHPLLEILGQTENAPVAAGRIGHLFGVQFHPEVTETLFGEQMFKNFCFGICGAKDRYPAETQAQRKITELRQEIGTKRVLIAVSGGSDSSTVAYLVKHAIGGRPGQARGVYIRGVDRPDDEAHARCYFSYEPWLEFGVVDATERFLKELTGLTDMERKREAYQGVYGAVLEGQARDFKASFISQGTLYTDVSESGGGYESGARKAQIKLHHNTGLNLSLPELIPLTDCVKDSGRNIGRAIGVPEELLTRHPFPGPGLIVRITGEVTAENLAIARHLDGIYIEELRKWGLYDKVWQAGAVVTDLITTCTKGDDAASGRVVSLWAVESVNGFTARWAELPYEFLRYVSRRITNEIREVGRVTYAISDKPPATIEWG